MQQSYINNEGKLVIVLLHDSDDTDIVAIGESIVKVDEISAEVGEV